MQFEFVALLAAFVLCTDLHHSSESDDVGVALLEDFKGNAFDEAIVFLDEVLDFIVCSDSFEGEL